MGVMVPCEKILERAQTGEGRSHRPERPHHAVARRDGARRPRDGAAGLQAAAPHRRRDDEPRAHGREDRAALQRAGRARPRRQPRRAGDHEPPERRGQARLRRAAPRRLREAPAAARRAEAQARPSRGGARESHADRVARRGRSRSPSSPACGCSTTSRSRRCANSSTGRRSSTPGSCTASTRESWSTRSTARWRARSSPKATRCSTRSSRKQASSRRAASTGSSRRTLWATTSSSTPTRRVRRCSRASTSCASKARQDKGEPNRCLGDFIAPRETGLRDHIGGFAVTTGFGLKELCDAVPRQARRLQRDHGRGARRPPGRGVRRVPAQARSRRVGLRARRGPDVPGLHRREVPRHPARRRLPRVPGPHGEGRSLEAARRREEHRASASPSRTRCGPARA